ncbi:hypothetical protein [Streptomyces hyaluromycini]|uniref:hypothetical protein n=1 Tax=Streptomyces hyaluromycini TaxID=1377993 RepID=UPI000B5CA3F6|nr:hypothetical protein [Streptomyces hyaluromycini]
MTNQPRSPYPNPWAQARRIAEEWEEAGRDGADRQTQIARVKAARARRAAALSEARIKAAVDKAVRETLAAPGFAESLGQLAQAAVPAQAAPQVPEKPLHEMTAEEWDAHRQAYWADRLPNHSRPMTISDLVGGRYEGDEA